MWLVATMLERGAVALCSSMEPPHSHLSKIQLQRYFTLWPYMVPFALLKSVSVAFIPTSLPSSMAHGA
jgi:hypothetical protein